MSLVDSNTDEPPSSNWRTWLSGTGVTVDTTLSTTSENPVQNKVIAKEINSIET
jgi:hypothetical protein